MIVLTGRAFVTTLPFVVRRVRLRRRYRCPTRSGWAIIAYTAIFPSILSQIFYISGVELIGANRAGLFINLVPIFGTLLSILILGEDIPAPITPSPWRWCSAASGSPRPADGRWPELLEWQTPGANAGFDHTPSTSNCSRLAKSIDLCARTFSRTVSGNGASR